MAEIIIMGELLVEIMRPKEDIPLYATDYFRGPFPSGAPGIFISTAARLGHSTAIISGVGNDDFGETIMRRLKHDGVDVSRVIIPEDGHTGIAFVTYFADGERKFLFYMDNSPCVKAKAPADMAGFEDTRYMHIMGCSLMADVNFAREIIKTMNMMKSHGVKISFDPNVRLEMMKDRVVLDMLHEVFDSSSILMPGVSELKMFTGKNDIGEAVKAVFENPNLEVLVLKNGSKGSQIYTRKGLEVEQPIYKVVQEDATGAGDSYDAAFICGIAEGKSLADAAKMGAAAGALNAAAFGPMEGKITPDNIRNMIEGKYHND
ncbi:MAG: sugar kinase [Synergistaceae bacterium]|nr:sugar kinase [Synergistaceae bacterium]MBR0151473.1 sugar kinase [Synergistaceae bacterium]